MNPPLLSSPLCVLSRPPLSPVDTEWQVLLLHLHLPVPADAKEKVSKQDGEERRHCVFLTFIFWWIDSSCDENKVPLLWFVERQKTETEWNNVIIKVHGLRGIVVRVINDGSRWKVDVSESICSRLANVLVSDKPNPFGSSSYLRDGPAVRVHSVQQQQQHFGFFASPKPNKKSYANKLNKTKQNIFNQGNDWILLLKRGIIISTKGETSAMMAFISALLLYTQIEWNNVISECMRVCLCLCVCLSLNPHHPPFLFPSHLTHVPDLSFLPPLM